MGYMKICKFFFLVLVLICPQLSWGECKVLACGFDMFNARIGVSNEANETQCWYCGPGPNSCNNNSIVPVTDSVGNIISLYQCVFRLLPGPGFRDVTPTRFCSGSPLISESYQDVDFTNAKKTIRIEGSSSSSNSLSDWKIFHGGVGCVWGECEYGYEPSEDKTKCVSVAEKASENACIRSHGADYQNGECVCESVKNLKQSTDKKTCVCQANHTWNDTMDMCVHNDKNDCNTTGGTWDSTNNKCECKAKNTTKSGTKCVCESSDYGWIDANDKRKGCKMTNWVLKKAECQIAKNKDSRVYWDTDTGECKCMDNENKLEFNNNKCEEKKEYQQCKKLNTDAEWDAENGECKCFDTNKFFTSGKCEYTTEYQEKQKQEKLNAEKISAANDIRSFAENSLDSVVAAFDRSKWRDADGNFNTARLASDSVAAVVLGTAGGLISSKVIKKKQVENGFEDIKCTIGNQEVADWGDEFQVGIQ